MLGSVSLVAVLCIGSVVGHGYLLEPIQRGSRWRENASAPENYNDNELFCGGFTTHHNANKGKCGICGDNWKDTVPRRHELGGKFGEGVVVKTYLPEEVVVIKTEISANHRGYLQFELCDLDVSFLNWSSEFIFSLNDFEVFARFSSISSLDIPTILYTSVCRCMISVSEASGRKSKCQLGGTSPKKATKSGFG